MKVRRGSVARLVWLGLPLLAACYSDRTAGSETDDAAFAAKAGSAAPRAASTPPKARDAGPASGGSGGCGAIRAPGASVKADTSAFTGVGGAGFDLVGICDCCGWNHEDPNCRSLVYTVPTIDNTSYPSCLDVSLAWTSCLETHGCICSGEVPEECRDIEVKLSECL